MIIALALTLLACACAIWGSITALRMGGELQRRGVRINGWLMRLNLIYWVNRYHEVTVKETGRPGPLYRQFTVAMLAALTLILVAALMMRFD